MYGTHMAHAMNALMSSFVVSASKTGSSGMTNLIANASMKTKINESEIKPIYTIGNCFFWRKTNTQRISKRVQTKG